MQMMGVCIFHLEQPQFQVKKAIQDNISIKKIDVRLYWRHGNRIGFLR